jgi:hypothetical protein
MRTTLLLVALLPLMAYTQSWCPPGATWVHNYADYLLGGAQGVSRVVYEGDTLVGGFTAQKLRETKVTAPWGSSEYTSFTYPNPMITHYADSIVYTWNVWPGEYDTLMWFDAAPGQFWSAPGTNDDPYARLTVLDTSTVIIDGVPLRQLLIERSFWEWAPPDTLRERMGFSFNYLNGWSWFITDQPWAGLLCYMDDEINFSSASVTDCGFTLRVNARSASNVLDLFPNPGTTHFTLDVPPGPHTITLCDATGRVVLEQRTADGRPVIGTEALPAGLYRVTVRDEQGAVSGTTWVKER